MQYRLRGFQESETMKTQPQKKAVIYCRFSPRRKADECESIETQIDYCKNYCKFHKLEIVDVFRDAGISGKDSKNRPGLQDALASAIKHKAVLVFYSLSRLARNTKETIEIADRLHKAKANLCSVTEKIDTSTAMGSAFFQIIAVLAELERKQISERTSDAMLFHQSNGRRMSQRCPFGWQLDPADPARMIPDKDELAAIQDIIQLRKDGLSYRAIAAQLEAEDYIPRPIQKKFKDRDVEVKGTWHFGTIRKILKRHGQH